MAVREILEKQEQRGRQGLTQEQMAEYERIQDEFQLPINSAEDMHHFEQQLGESSRRHRLVGLVNDISGVYESIQYCYSFSDGCFCSVRRKNREGNGVSNHEQNHNATGGHGIFMDC